MRTKLRLRAVIWVTLAVIVAAPLVWTDTSHSGVEEEIANLRKELVESKRTSRRSKLFSNALCELEGHRR